MVPISQIDALQGRLYFRGIDATELALSHSFEAVLHLLLFGRLPTEKEEAHLASQLIKMRQKHWLESPNLDLHALARQIQTLVNKDGLLSGLLSFVACIPVAIASAWNQRGKIIMKMPCSELRHVSNLAWMLGLKTKNAIVSILERLLILQMDDPNNPSLSALCDVIENGGSVSEALIAALEKHCDPLHHGAGYQVMKMVEEIKQVGDVRKALEARIARGDRIFGLGHRIYRTIDPRAIVLKRILQAHAIKTGYHWLVDIIDKIAITGPELLKQTKGIDVYPNVDLYNAAVVTTLGLPTEINTDLFAVARSAGWAAHIFEILG